MRDARLPVLGLLFPLAVLVGCTGKAPAPHAEPEDVAVPFYAPPSGAPALCAALAGTTHVTGLGTTLGTLTTRPEDVVAGITWLLRSTSCRGCSRGREPARTAALPPRWRTGRRALGRARASVDRRRPHADQRGTGRRRPPRARPSAASRHEAAPDRHRRRARSLRRADDGPRGAGGRPVHARRDAGGVQADFAIDACVDAASMTLRNDLGHPVLVHTTGTPGRPYGSMTAEVPGIGAPPARRSGRTADAR